MIEAIILAAGESRRMGALKPLLRIGEHTALQIIVRTLENAGVDRVHVVVGFRAEFIIEHSRAEANFVRNEDYKKGQFSSLQTGIKALSRECKAALVCLVDQPHVRANWIRRIIRGYEQQNACIVRPSFGGKSGHPVLYSHRLFEEIVNMPPSATAKELMQKYLSCTAFVEIDSDGILYDADTPDDFIFIQKFVNDAPGEPPDA